MYFKLKLSSGSCVRFEKSVVEYAVSILFKSNSVGKRRELLLYALVLVYNRQLQRARLTPVRQNITCESDL
jgi:hypothetical protein